MVLGVREVCAAVGWGKGSEMDSSDGVLRGAAGWGGGGVTMRCSGIQCVAREAFGGGPGPTYFGMYSSRKGTKPKNRVYPAPSIRVDSSQEPNTSTTAP